MAQTRRAFLKGVAAVSAVAACDTALGKDSAGEHGLPDGVKRIAIEEAFVTQEIADQWARVLAGSNVDPGFAEMGRSILGDSPGARALHAKLVDLGPGRIRQMDQDGISMQVLSLTAPGVQVFAADVATALAEQANDRLGEAIKAYPERFAGLAALAPQEPAHAARELERAVTALGMKGAIINSHTMGEYLDERKFWPIFEASQALDVPIYLHPTTPSPGMIQPFLDYGLWFAGWGFALETGTHAMRLIMSGVFDHFPRLRFVLGHMGEGLPFWLQRIDNRYQLEVRLGIVRALPRLPSQYFLDHFVVTTSGVTSVPVLKLVHELLGPERILFAADYPYETVPDAVAFMDAAPLSKADKIKILSGNAERLLKLN